MKLKSSFVANDAAISVDGCVRRHSTLVRCLQLLVVLVAGLALWPQNSSAQQTPGIRFQFPQVRFTVPVNSTNMTFFGIASTNIVNSNPSTNNTVVTVYGATNANLTLNLSGLPAGVGVYLSDPNTNPVSGYMSGSSNICLVINTTNVAEGVYSFSLNASGLDTNGLPTTNSMPFVLQAAHIWVGGISSVNAANNNGLNVSNNWATATNFLGGPPNAGDDVVFFDAGAQTNATFSTGVAFTNIYITANTTIGSMRFAQSAYTNYNSVTNAFSATNTEYYSLFIGGGTPTANTPVTLNLTGTNGLSILQDYIGDIAQSPYPYASLGVFFSGTNGTLLVSNPATSFFGVFGPNAEQPTLCMSNLGTFILYAKRAGCSDFQVYPNYGGINAAINQGVGSNAYTGHPKQMWNNIYLARTNTITATYVDPNNYTNGYTRGYAMTVQNNEQQGNGSSTATYFYLGRTNNFYMDSIDFVGSSSASGNNGGVKYTVYEGKNSTNPGTWFRGTNGTSRMSIFSVSDDDGTNEASSNVKATVDFTAGNGGTGQGYINLLVDRLYVARDRTMITSNQTPNVQGDLYFGNGTVDVNSMYLGDQEHSNKVDWTSMGAQAYLNYCQGRLWLTNGGYVPSVVKVNNNLVLGYTADGNPTASAQQFNTFGQIVVSSNVTLQVSNVICDGGLNIYSGSGRQNTITILRGGNLIITNAIGNLDPGSAFFNDPDPAGILLDNLSMSAGTLSVFVNPGITNAYVRTLTTPGTIPSIVKVVSLTGTNSFPCQIPVIYCANTPAPFLNADVSALGALYHGYILNNQNNKTVDVYITTNPPNNLVWVGGQNNTWDTASTNWVIAGTSTVTNFNLGDQVTFNDTSSITNVVIDASVVPSQTGVGVTISNNLMQYTFTGGTIAGTAQVVKSGTNLVDFEAVEQGPILLTAGTVVSTGGGAGLGTTTVYTNVVLNWAGSINGGLTATGMVNLALGSSLAGPVVLGLNTIMINNGTINTGSGNSITMLVGSCITNLVNGTINVGTGIGNGATWDCTNGCTIANFGNINLYQPKLSIEGLLFGTGTISDPNSGGYDTASSPTRVVINSYGLLSPGTTPIGSVSNMTLQCRLDFNNDPQNGQSEGAGVSTVRIEVDKSQSPPNDYFKVDRWNNSTGYLLMTNINPGAGNFAVGDVFQIFNNTSGYNYNYQDTPGFSPTMQPNVPGPNLVWGTTNFNLYGTITVTTNTLVWNGAGNGSWDTNGSGNNWKYSQTYSDFQGALFNDSASSTLVNITTNVAPLGSYIITNTDGMSYTNVITNQPDIYPGMIVNTTGNYVMSGQGHIRGITGLYKTGSGTLTLLTSNDFSGQVVVDGGTLAISNYTTPASVLSGSIVSLGIAGLGAMQNDLILDGATLSYLGLANVQLSNGKNTELVFNAGGATINVNSATNALFINKQVTGPGSLTKTGPGMLQMQNTVDAYMGGTIVNAGIVQLTAAALGFGPLTLNNSGALQLTNGMTLTNQINIAGGSTSIQALGIGTNIFNGIWAGSGSVTFSNGAVCVFNSSMNGFSGTLSLGPSTGLFQLNNVTNASTVCTGSIAASFDLGSGSATLANLYGGGLTYNLGSLAGGPNTILTGRETNNLVLAAATSYSIGGNNNSSSFNGRITNGLDTVTVAKIGAGTLWLNGNSTYTGTTTVSGGTLSGAGSIASPLTVSSGGTLSAGTSGTANGTFTISNSATLGGTTLLKINQALTPANDMIAVTGTLTGGGALVVTNLGSTLINGTTFKLFSQAVSGFSSLTLPTGGTGYMWTTNLNLNGSITLVSGGTNNVNQNPTNIVASVSGSTLTLKWPTDHIGWRLLCQTDSLSVGLTQSTNNWFYVSGSSTTNAVAVPLVPSNPTVFYRLTYP